MKATKTLENRIKTVLFYSSQSNVEWKEKNNNLKQGEVFLVDVWVPQDAHFKVGLWTEAGLDDEVFGSLWKDTLTIGAIEV